MCKQLSRVTGCRSLKRKRKLRARWQQQTGTCAAPETKETAAIKQRKRGGMGGADRDRGIAIGRHHRLLNGNGNSSVMSMMLSVSVSPSHPAQS